jgi:hypothetical protein
MLTVVFTSMQLFRALGRGELRALVSGGGPVEPPLSAAATQAWAAASALLSPLSQQGDLPAQLAQAMAVRASR